MARRKSLFKLPFVKARVNKKTFFNILGFLLLTTGIILLVSFFHLFSQSSEEGGRILNQINESLTTYFGFLSILLPFIFFLIAGHFFNSKKLKFIKPNITIGSILVFISLLGIIQSGQWGRFIYENLSLDFSTTGAIIILTVSFFMGLILLLDTSVDAFVLFIIKLFGSFFTFLRTYLFREVLDRDKLSAREEEEVQEKFIKDRAIYKPKPLEGKSQTHPATSKDMVIRPISSAGSATWVYPPLNILADVAQKEADRGDVKQNADMIEKTLESFGIRTKVGEINYGPTVTQYALQITQGTKLSKITALANDLALALAAPTGQIRIEAPIPGRSLVGIEIPNRKPEIVTLKRMLVSNAFKNSQDPLLVPMGLDVSGEPYTASIAKMPHALIAGATGSGKSVMLNAWISTFLFRTKPEELRLILVDPKRVELTLYNDVPHLLTPVIVDPEKIISALRWTVGEMESRHKEFARVQARNLEAYNVTPGIEKKPYILFIIDELADIMAIAPGDVEDQITRIAQMARATGIHLVLATQSPRVDVITGLMKANIPTRIAFNVSSLVDSRVIIDTPGAEKLVGRGDMLYLPPDQAKPRRIQGPYITEKEVTELVKFLRAKGPIVHYTEEITRQEIHTGTFGSLTGGNGDDHDPLFNKALELISQSDKASASFLQRRLSVGYARAARILDQLEAAGYVGPAEGSKPREILRRGVEVDSQTGK